MRRIAMPALIALSALVFCSTAEAKGPVPAEACGASGCERTVFELLPADLVLPPDLMTGSADESTPPAGASEWFSVSFRLADNRGRVDDRCRTANPPYFCDPRRDAVVLADGSYVAGDHPSGDGLVWRRLAPRETAVYADLTRELEPFPAATMPGLPAPTAGGDGPWLWLAIAGLLALGGAVGLVRHRAGGRGVAGPPPPRGAV